MQAKQRFFFMVTGAVLGVTILLIGMAVSPTAAQRDTFGEITCTGLTVVNPDGTMAVWLRSDKYGGGVSVASKDGMPRASMDVTERGGTVLVSGKGVSLAGMLITEHGGAVRVTGKGGKLASMAVDKDGGYVLVRDRDGAEKILD